MQRAVCLRAPTWPTRVFCRFLCGLAPARPALPLIGVPCSLLPTPCLQLRCGQLLVFRHSSAMRSRSTGRPPTRCSATISAASSGLTFAVPHGLGVDHHHGPVFALVQAAGFVDPHPAAQPGIASQLLQPRVQVALSIARCRRAAAHRRGGRCGRQKRGVRMRASGKPPSCGCIQSKASAAANSPAVNDFEGVGLLPVHKLAKNRLALMAYGKTPFFERARLQSLP